MTEGTRRWTRLLGAAALALVPLAAAGQALDLGRGGGQPLEITARQGIEWDRNNQRYTARGAARAAQGSTTIEADELIAHYRAKPQGGTEVFRLEAVGHVRITSPTQRVQADRGVYDTDTSVMVLTGRDLKLTTPTEQVTARDSLEYWETRQVAVARGNALVVSGDKRMRADVITAYFTTAHAPQRPAAAARASAAPRRPGAPAQAAAAPAPSGEGAGQRRITRAEGFGNVLVSSATEVARGDRGVYNADTGIATLAGNVRLTRGQNQLQGDFAEMNLNTGISRLLTRSEQTADGRVRVLLTPDGPAAAPAPAAPQRR